MTLSITQKQHEPENIASLPNKRLEIYLDDKSKWRWRLISKAQIRAEASQGYVSKQGCLNAVKQIRNIMQDADIVYTQDN